MRDRHGHGHGSLGDGMNAGGSDPGRTYVRDISALRTGLRAFARRLRTGGGALAITLIVGLANPGLAPRTAAQTPPTGFDLIGDQTPVSLLGELPVHDPTLGRTAGSGGVSGGKKTADVELLRSIDRLATDGFRIETTSFRNSQFVRRKFATVVMD